MHLSCKGTIVIQVFLITYPHDPSMEDFYRTKAGIGSALSLNNALFFQLFPFHILLDTSCCVVQAGAVVQRLLPKLARGVSAASVLRLRHPVLPAFDRESIMSRALNNVFIVQARS